MTEKLATNKADVKDHEAGREDAKKALEEAAAIRQKEADAYAKEKAEAETNIGAMGKAVAAVEKGMAGSFLQTNVANIVRRYTMEQAEVPDMTRQELLSFFSSGGQEGEDSDYEPQSGEITGILKQ